MQKEQNGVPKDPESYDVKKLFEWVSGAEDDQVIPLGAPAVRSYHRSSAEDRVIIKIAVPVVVRWMQGSSLSTLVCARSTCRSPLGCFTTRKV